MSNAMQFFSSILLEEGKNGMIEGKKSEFNLFPGTLHATASTGDTSMGEGAEQRGKMELYDAQRDTPGVHGSKIVSGMVVSASNRFGIVCNHIYLELHCHCACISTTAYSNLANSHHPEQALDCFCRQKGL